MIDHLVTADGLRRGPPLGRGENNNFMKRMKSDPDMLEEYNFTGGVRGKYAKRYKEGNDVVIIDPDVAKYFPDHESVNKALRSLTQIIKRQRKPEQRHRVGRS
jgi:hypothetical protein